VASISRRVSPTRSSSASLSNTGGKELGKTDHDSAGRPKGADELGMILPTNT